MKKFIVYLLTLLLLFIPLGACTKQPNSEKSDKIKIVSAIFPSYDWVREILGDRVVNADLTLLTDSGVDLHSYQPSAQDMITISDCDMLIYVGGESDEWVQDALRANENPKQIVIDLLQVLGDARGETDGEADEHVWLSLKNAKILCTHIADQLAQLDTDGAKAYADNLTVYMEKLEKLDQQYRETTETAGQNKLVFGDRFAFRYLFDDYGLECYAAFDGCSADAEVSFDTIISLADKLDVLKLPVVLVSESSDQALAKAIIDSTTAKNQKILVMNSIQSVTADQIEKGITYLSVMESNLAVLQSALQQ